MKAQRPTPGRSHQMQIRARMSMSADGYVTTPDGWPALTADPAFVSGKSHGIQEFLEGCEAGPDGPHDVGARPHQRPVAVAEPGGVRARFAASARYPRRRGQRRRPVAAAGEA